jgi:hypothetical protein
MNERERAAIQQALEVLEQLPVAEGYVADVDDAIIALRAALEQPLDDVTSIMLDVVPGADGEGVEVFAKTVDDVVRKLTEMGQRIEELELGHSPRREWRSLSEPDIEACLRIPAGRDELSRLEFARAVEAKLKEKNNR